MKLSIASGVSGAVALLVGQAAGLSDPEVLGALTVVIAAVPVGIAGLVRNGGIRGVLGALWRGAPK